MFTLSVVTMFYVYYGKDSIKYATIVAAAFLGTTGQVMPGRGERNEDIELGQPPEVGDEVQDHGGDQGDQGLGDV